MRKRVLIAFVVAFLAPVPAQATSVHHVHPSVVTHGLRITLRVGRRSYPRDALVSVTLTIRNTTHHAISIISGLNAPKVVVLDASGQEVYDPINPLGALTLITPLGPGPESFQLHGGRSWTSDTYVVLHGNRLAAHVILGNVRRPGPEVDIMSPRLKLRLTSEAPPQVVLSASPLQARLIPRAPESGPLLSFRQEQCGDLATGDGWTTTDSRVVVPGVPDTCTTYTWHAIAGWLDHPVATIVYSAPSKSTWSLR